ncbi:hypothetical protein AZI86_11310 [Bdellovibrio bacteriovorus]|uniref:Glycosyl hydrolase family 13 catalytic domain-containing protein n=1 Tax=Bdellovibrio bacteriovorus TaxID=959 RepID=A0A150WLS9_BDEBC|nr:alpha-amylase family glycosyl hydrolase [Bdellovibrio bacteriovorus]KYG64785.1 hypothetical protein AZI86_11310 [Bdellovibrio bacteriovorus]
MFKFIFFFFFGFLSCRALAYDVIYGVSPYYFTQGRPLTVISEITRRLPELKDLGVTVLWVQPIFPSAEPGQSYDTIDFFTINPSYGTEEQFKNLIRNAHALNIKVILDIALNHTPLQHPFAQEVLRNGKASRLYDFYQHEIETASVYSQFQNILMVDEIPFVYYFWEKLVNLNYAHPAVQRYAIEVLRHWTLKFSVDGFRLDAGWAPASRWPLFYESIVKELKKINPEALILAEDKAFFAAGPYTWAYDWNNQDPDWVSRWAFQTGEGHEETIFNEKDPEAAAQYLADILREQKNKDASRVARYLQNNDTPSFLFSHTREQTFFAASVMAFLPGPLLMFYGQAEGFKYPQWHLPSIQPEITLAEHDASLWLHYQKLIRWRKSLGGFNTITSVKRMAAQVHVTVQGSHKVTFDFANQKVTVNGISAGGAN